MQFIIKTPPEELLRAKKWWQDLEGQWKMAYNEALFGNGPTLEPPHDDALMVLLIGVDTIRLAGPTAIHPNTSVKLTTLNGLIPLYQLRYLSITNMQFENLKPLYRHTKLQHLFVYENDLKSIEGVENMLELEDFYFQQNQVSDLSPVRKLTKLQTLYASNNSFERINGLTPEHGDKLKRFHITPNDQLPDREIIRVQNELGIICRKG
ncbi:MAG TPA: hypothetical protein PKA00_20520 [Saprospiraceae bacterium]|nr:hypothetical protein [Saprospiraceae bacterium]HMQ85307.1 hypothetical protein [Saprospiraceae bacterium]